MKVLLAAMIMLSTTNANARGGSHGHIGSPSATYSAHITKSHIYTIKPTPNKPRKARYK